VYFSADRTSCSVVDYWHDRVSVSVSLSDMLCIVAKRYTLQQECIYE